MAGGKRKAEDDPEGAPASHHKAGASAPSGASPDRRLKCLLAVRALNQQFVRWTQRQLAEHLDLLWIPGVEDYLAHAQRLREEFEDLSAARAEAEAPKSPFLSSTLKPVEPPAKTTAEPTGPGSAKLQVGGERKSGAPAKASPPLPPASIWSAFTAGAAKPAGALDAAASASAASSSALPSSSASLPGFGAGTSGSAPKPPLFAFAGTTGGSFPGGTASSSPAGAGSAGAPGLAPASPSVGVSAPATSSSPATSWAFGASSGTATVSSFTGFKATPSPASGASAPAFSFGSAAASSPSSSAVPSPAVPSAASSSKAAAAVFGSSAASASAKLPAFSVSGPSPFKFGGTTAAGGSSSASSSSSSSSSFVFNASPSASSGAAFPSFTFGSSSSSSSPFSSSSSSSPFSSSSAPLSFGLTAPAFGASASPALSFAPPAGAAPLFGFGAAAAAGAGSAAAAAADATAATDKDEGAADEEEGEEERPSSPSVQKAAEAEGVSTLHEVKAKLYQQPVGGGEGGPAKWRDRGVGTVAVKVHKGAGGGGEGGGDSKDRYSLLFRNEVGKVVVNAPIVKTTKPIHNKRSVTALLHSIQDDTAVGGEEEEGGGEQGGNGKPTLSMYMFRVASEEVAKEFLAALVDSAAKA